MVGIGLTNDELIIAAYAAILFATNLVAIILGAAIIFRLLGMHVAVSEKDESRWVRRTTMSFTLLAVILAAPLLMNVLEKSRAGQARPAIYPVSADVRNAVWAYIRNQQNLDLITMARDSVEPDTGITLMVTTGSTLKSTVNNDLVDIVRTARGNKDAIVRVFILLEAPQANP